MTNFQDASSQMPSTDSANSKETSVPSSQAAPSPKRKKTHSAKERRPIIWPLYLLLFLVFSLAAAAGLYFFQTLTQQKLEITEFVSANRINKQKISQLDRGFSQQIHQLVNTSKDNSQQLTKLDKQSLYITQKLTELGASSRSDWLLAEAEYLLHLANQRLSLEHDAKSAEAILTTADSVLTENDDPGLLPIRQALANEILSLQQVNTFDKEGIYLQLAAVITALDKLDKDAYLGSRLSKNKQQKVDSITSPTDSENKNSLQELWRQIWSDLRQAFIIRRLDQPVEPLLAPEQSYYLKQNLRLMLEQANLALLDNSTQIFQDSLLKASKWINNYFDTKDAQISALLVNINALKRIDIEQTTPDISNSLRLLKTKIEAMYRNHRLGKLSSPDMENQERLIKALEKQLQEQTK